jgi:hypothetical protein
MPGTLVHDANVTKLHSAVAISTATTTTGTGVKVGKPGRCRFKLTNGTISGAGATFVTTIQGSNDDSTYVDLANFSAITTASQTRWVTAQVAYKYLRAVTVSTGTNPTSTLTCSMEELHYLQTPTDHA